MTSVDNGRELVWRRVEDRRRSVILELCGLLPMLEVPGEDEKRDGVVAKLMVRLTGPFEWPTFASRKTWWRVSFDECN